MQIMRYANAHSRKIVTLVFLTLLAACGGSGINERATATPSLETPIISTASPTPVPDMAYLVRGSETSESVVTRVEGSISALSAASGIEFVTLSEISESELGLRAKVVFFLPPDPGVNDLAARFPAVQFVAIGINGLSAADNLTMVGPNGLGADQIGFIAGVLAAAVTPDWRVGAVSVQKSGEEHASNLAFQNGVMFYCGLCRPAYPPFHSYPLGVEASSSEISAVQNAIAALSNLDVNTIFLSPQLSAAASVETLEAPGLSFIGGESPGEILGDKWTATVRSAPEVAIAEIWDRVWMGESGGTIAMPIVIEDINPERLTPGREAWVREVLRDLFHGYIDTGVDPITGIAH